MTEVASYPISQNSTMIRLKDDDFIKAAGLDRSGKSGRKSSMERLLEQSLNTAYDNHAEDQTFHGQKGNRMARSEFVGVSITPERPENLKSDQFVQDAGLSRTGRVARKSSMERLLEDQLQTKEDTPQPDTEDHYNTRVCNKSPTMSTSPLPQAEMERKVSSASSNEEDKPQKQPGRKSSIYEQKQIEAPVLTKGNRITSRTEHLFQQYERDIKVHEAKPLGDVNRNERNQEKQFENNDKEKSKVETAREEKEKELAEMRRLYQQRLEDEEKGRHEERMRQKEANALKNQSFDSIEDSPTNTCNGQRRVSNASSTDSESSNKQTGRKNSIYQQKQIDAPVTTRGNQIASRTENLFKQYQRDVNEGGKKEGEKSKVDIAREEKERELQQMRLLYQQRVEEDERVHEEERLRERENMELKSGKVLGDVKNRYLQTATEGKQDSEDEEQVQTDEKGDAITKSGGKIEIVKSADGVGSIKERFGSLGKSSWQKSENPEGRDTDEVDTNTVNSARNIFKNFENQKQDEKRSFNRPTQRKVKDPKELMNMRKKATYGEEEVEDGVVKKSIVLDENELGSSESRREALNAYKSRTSASDSDGYGGSNSPCSPSSPISEDYGSEGEQ